MSECRTSRRAADQSRAFTIVELMVSMAILTATMIAVAAIFSIGSEAAGRTESHAEIIESSAAFQQTVAGELNHMVGGLLIIESPPPTLVRAEVHGGPQLFRLRHDRLVFIASRGSEGDYQSFTDPTRGDPITDPTKAPAGSPEALVYYGPGIPVSGNGTATGDRRPFDDSGVLAASEWVFARRAILLMGAAPAVTGWSPPDMAAFDNGLLTSAPEIFESRMDAMVSSAAEPATSATLIQNLLGISVDTPTARLSDLWSPNLTPITTNLTNSIEADYYARSGFTFQPRFADFRIEWTDGRRVDPANNDFSTRWFGLAPDRTETPNLSNAGTINAMKYQARMRGFPGAGNPSNPNTTNPDNSPTETAAFANIEWSATGITSDAAARYRAVWRADTWAYRPKALRFTYRIYDTTQRLNQGTTVDFNEDGLADPDPTTPGASYVTTRYGQEFSIVVPLP